jgi:hypothetical protein
MRSRLIGAAVLSIGLLASACANATTDDGAGDGGGISYHTGATQVVLRIERGGGFVPIEYSLTDMPMFSLFGDGLVVIPGAQIEIYPGPALPAMSQMRLTPEAIQLLLQKAVDAGLDVDRDYTDLGSIGIADAPTTTFTLTIDGQVHTTNVYALGMLDTAPDGMDPDEFQARQDLLALQDYAMDLSWLPEGTVSDEGMFEPSGLRVFVGDYRPDDALVEPPIDWPLTPALSAFGDPVQNGPEGMRCGAVTGDDAAVLVPLVNQANQLTPWVSDGTRFGLLLRPLLPDETGC